MPIIIELVEILVSTMYQFSEVSTYKLTLMSNSIICLHIDVSEILWGSEKEAQKKSRVRFCEDQKKSTSRRMCVHV